MKGATGAQLDKALFEVEPGSLDNHPPQVRTVAGKSYRIYEGDLAVCTSADAMYLIFRLQGGDSAEPTPTPTPLEVYSLFDDVARQLP